MKYNIVKLGFLPALFLATVMFAQDRMDVSGSWRLALDWDDVGLQQQWYNAALPGTDVLPLPGSLQAQGFGEKPTIDGPWTAHIGMGVWKNNPRYARYMAPDNFKSPVFLMPDRLYVGSAWYQRDILIPEEWAGMPLRLFLERPHWKTTVWLDGRELGTQRLLSTPHVYDLGTAEPGQYRLTIRVDNTVDPYVGMDAHSVSDQTQSNWNGIAGRMELIGSPALSIEQVRSFPDVDRRSVTLELRMSTPAGKGKVRVAANGVNNNPHQVNAETFAITWEDYIASVDYDLGLDARLWDEHEPHLYQIQLALLSGGIFSRKEVHRKELLFGLREWGIEDRMFTVNGTTTKLRGTLDCAIWPLTGYPATDTESWRKVMRACKEFGLNHIRFHSWCPPEAAFIAANEMGIYLLVEAGIWSHFVGEDEALQEWVLKEEAPAILAAYGNHPSFFGFGIGNEGINPPSREVFSSIFIEQCKRNDGRHLYTDFAHTGTSEKVDFMIKVHLNVETDGHSERFHLRNLIAHSTRANFGAAMEHADRPVIAHEIVQQAIMPDFEEMERYTGVLKPKNFEIFRDIIEENNMGHFMEELFMSQGRFQTLLYKAEIEAHLRSRNFSGYQLLGINDFSGQGTALVGALNVFWEPKRYVTAAEYRRFQNTVVPLAEFDKRVWTKDEVFSADLLVSQFGPADLTNQVVDWKVKYANGQVIDAGVFGELLLRQGDVRDIGSIAVPLNGIAAPAELTLEVALAGTEFVNSWNIYVYDRPGLMSAPAGILVADSLSHEVFETLQSGGTVCLFIDPNQIQGAEGYFSWLPFAWNQVTFPQQRNVSKGLLIKSDHPALAGFPARDYSTWQWQDALENARPVDLSHIFPPDQRAIVQYNDSWTHGRKLGLIYEARVGGGKLLFCSFDMNKQARSCPVLSQLRRSLLSYAASDAFDPQVEITHDQLAGMIREKCSVILMQIGGRIAAVSSEQPGYEREEMTDGNPDTFWHSRFSPDKDPLPQWVVIELPKVIPLEGLRYLPRQDKPIGRVTEYAVYMSDDGKTWNQPVSEGRILPDNEEKQIRFANPVEGRFVRFEIRKSEHDVAAIGQLDILFDVDEAIRQGLIDPSGFSFENQ